MNERLAISYGWLLALAGWLTRKRCDHKSVAMLNARRFQCLISSFLGKTEGQIPVRHGAGFLGSLEKAGLRTESRPF